MSQPIEAIDIEIDISDDYYTATLTLSHAMFTHREENFRAILDELKKANVVFGIDEEAIKNALSEDVILKQFVAASGIPHKNGTDAYLTHYVSFEGASKPIVQEDGTVDFKNLLQVSSIKAGELLSEKTPVVPGCDGTTVTGKTIKHKPGKDIAWKVGENVAISEDGLRVTSLINGIAKLIKDRITVSMHIELNEVGPETGNIYFGGDVHVKGNVLAGYTVHCDGDLLIDGVVESAIIKTNGDLTVHKGILGHGGSDIIVGGKLTTKFIENANVYAKGDIETGEIINSKVLCDSKITVKGKKGLIIGGDITSKYMIEANQIGSKLGVITSINLGVDVSAIQELKYLKETLIELRIVETRLKARIPVLQNNALMQPEVGGHQDLLEQYKSSLLSIQIEIEDKQQRLDHLMDALRKVNQGSVKINSIHPDTVIRIGDSKYFVDESLSACIISKAGDHVIAISLEKGAKK